MNKWVSSYISNYTKVLNDIPVDQISDLICEFKKYLDTVRKPYLTVTGSPMQRLEQILDFIK